MMPTLGEMVVVVPQAFQWLANPHDDRNVIGQDPDRASVQAGQSWHEPSWERYTSTLLRKGFGLLVVRDGKFAVGPTWWDSGD